VSLEDLVLNENQKEKVPQHFFVFPEEVPESKQKTLCEHLHEEVLRHGIFANFVRIPEKETRFFFQSFFFSVKLKFSKKNLCG
jgi:hypothetical protein